MNHQFGKKLRVSLLVVAATIGVLSPRRATAMDEGTLQAQADATEATSRERDDETPSFGPVIERLIVHPGDSRSQCVLDLDSGEYSLAPPDVYELLRIRSDDATRVGRLKVRRVHRDRSTASVIDVVNLPVLEVGDQVTNQQHPENPQAPNQSSDAQRKQQLPTGVLSGRFVYDGEPPNAKDRYPSFAKLAPDRPQEPGPDGRFSGVEAIYREYLKHNIRPTTIDQSLRVGKDKGLADVVIWVVSRDIAWPPSPEGQSPVTIQIRNGVFLPQTTAITVGQPLVIENHDPVEQSVSGMFYRTSNQAFNVLLRAGSGSSSRTMTFPVSEPFPARLSLEHCPWASGLLFVHSNPYVAISQQDGSFRIPNLPPGEWEFQAWHARSGYVSIWPKGRFTQKIVAGENRLLAFKIPPEQFNAQVVDESVTLSGEWRIVAATQRGEPVDKFNFDGMRWTIGEEKLDIRPATINMAGVATTPLPSFTYSVDNTQSPAHFNWTMQVGDQSMEINAIYELKGELLRVCFPQRGEPRPTGFETRGQKWSVYEFRRVLKE